ncbi:hypothetical protein QAD02_021920 [Eretmocerus hayati]|uniref:Uncharacterized protein n=1 Tax=Eretmocerus hayati TaxID=131215 RepID=A0ACC2PTL5_9HYME|nr:hypothetical protein QAD02_021920 [Eretmocerus hayati]
MAQRARWDSKKVDLCTGWGGFGGATLVRAVQGWLTASTRTTGESKLFLERTCASAHPKDSYTTASSGPVSSRTHGRGEFGRKHENGAIVSTGPGVDMCIGSSAGPREQNQTVKGQFAVQGSIPSPIFPRTHGRGELGRNHENGGIVSTGAGVDMCIGSSAGPRYDFLDQIRPRQQDGTVKEQIHVQDGVPCVMLLWPVQYRDG